MTSRLPYQGPRGGKLHVEGPSLLSLPAHHLQITALKAGPRLSAWSFCLCDLPQTWDPLPPTHSAIVGKSLPLICKMGVRKPPSQDYCENLVRRGMCSMKHRTCLVTGMIADI